MSSKVINRWWFTTSGGHCIGIIKTIDPNNNEEKFRIGLADGFNELLDEQRILSHGARFYPEVIK